MIASNTTTSNTLVTVIVFASTAPWLRAVTPWQEGAGGLARFSPAHLLRSTEKPHASSKSRGTYL
jgi:hypothetical protein